MTIKKSTKHKIKKTVRLAVRALVKIYLIGAFLSIVWLLGRLYQEQKYDDSFANFKNQTIETYYFTTPQIVDDQLGTTKYVLGELAIGYCTRKEEVDKLLTN